jgi:hypothetical protein
VSRSEVGLIWKRANKKNTRLGARLDALAWSRGLSARMVEDGMIKDGPGDEQTEPAQSKAGAMNHSWRRVALQSGGETDADCRLSVPPPPPGPTAPLPLPSLACSSLSLLSPSMRAPLPDRRVLQNPPRG